LPPDMHHAADDITHLAFADLLKKPSGYQDCETEDEMLAVLRRAIEHDAVDALRAGSAVRGSCWRGSSARRSGRARPRGRSGRGTGLVGVDAARQRGGGTRGGARPRLSQSPDTRTLPRPMTQVMGDGIMALFGAPVAHEDHAVRACYAALRMQESVGRYAEGVRRVEGIPIQIRVGLNSGEVVVRAISGDLHMDYSAIGQTTHLASRMEQMAIPGSILMTANTFSPAEGFIKVKPLGPLPVKGLSGPMKVYEVVGVEPVRSRLHATAVRSLTRFVGRDPEMEQLRIALDRAKGGHGQVVAVVGEPGVGKSRLYWEFVHSHRTEGCLVLESRSVSYGQATSYLPVIDLLKAYFAIEGRDDPRRVREKITGRLLSLDESLRPTLPAFLALLDLPVDDHAWHALDAPQRRQKTFDAIKRLLLRESEVRPLILVFEDLHWIDSQTQAVLDAFMDSLPTVRVVLLINYRPEYGHSWGSKTFYQQIRIDPLPALHDRRQFPGGAPWPNT
jgi:class 3 adenylate cyclase